MSKKKTVENVAETAENVAETAENAAETAETPEAETKKAVKVKKAGCPYEATIEVALAVLRKNVGLGTKETLKPVATLPQGTKVTIIEERDGYLRLNNGLWVSAESVEI